MTISSVSVDRTVIAGFPTWCGVPADPSAASTPIVFLHSAFTDETSFENWTVQFASRGYRTYAPARRGRSGIGPARAAGVTFDDYVSDTEAVIAALGCPPIVVGHSLGALVAQRIAERGEVRALVLIAPAPPSKLTARAVAIPWLAPLLPGILAGRPFVITPRAADVIALNQVSADRRRTIDSRLTHESGKVFRAMLAGSIRIDASKVTAPVFVAGGDRDRIVSTRLLIRTAEHYRTHARIYANHGHWILDEPGSEGLVSDIAEWLETVPDPSRTGFDRRVAGRG